MWTLLVGPPSSGKTEIIDSLGLVPGAVSVSTVAKAGLLSGRAGSAGGLLMTRFTEGTGLLLVKDLTSILSEASATRTEVLASMREVFDGKVVRVVGSRDTPLEWSGKIGFVGGVTEEIEHHRNAIGLMGDRFVYLPIPTVDDRLAVAQKAITNNARHPYLRRRLATCIGEFFDTIPPTIHPTVLSPDEEHWLATAADFASRTRSPVMRDARTGQVDLVPQPELPAKLVGEFTQLWHGAKLIGGTHAQARAVIRAAAIGCIPQQRRQARLALVAIDQPARTIEVALRMRTNTPVAYRALEELAALGVLNDDPVRSGAGALWTPTAWLANSIHAMPQRDAT